MPVNVRIVQGLQEAAGILASDRGAQLLGGGTLRDARRSTKASMTDGTLLRALDPLLLAMNTGGARVELGAGVTMAMVLANRDLSFLHAAARGIGGPAVRTMATIGGNLFAATPYGDFTTALLALDAVVTLHAGFGGARVMPLEELLANRARGGVGLVASRRLQPPGRRRCVPLSSKSRGCGRRASRCCRSRRTCRRTPDGSAARGSPMARWGRRRCAPRRSSACWRAAASTQPPLRRRRPRALEGTRPADRRDRVGMVSPRSIAGASAAGCCRRDSLRNANGKDARPVSPQRLRPRGLRRAGGNLLDASGAGSAISPRNSAAARAPAASAPCWSMANRDLACLTLAETCEGRRSKPPPASPTGRRCIRCRPPSWSISPRNAASARPAC